MLSDLELLALFNLQETHKKLDSLFCRCSGNPDGVECKLAELNMVVLDCISHEYTIGITSKGLQYLRENQDRCELLFKGKKNAYHND